MNLLPADGPLQLEGIPSTQPLQIGVRPEHVRIGTEGVGAKVALVEPIGSDAYVHLALDRFVLVARTDAAGRPAVGDVVHVRVSRERVHLFDAETGERVPWT